MATTVQPKPWHIVCLALFALPFAAVGVWSGIEAGREIAAYRRMQGWQETPAKILQTELKTDCDGEGCTNWVTAEYAYTYQGRQYTGHRVSLHGGSDNVGSFQEDAYRQLRKHKISGRPFRCYANPERPAEAILFRDLREEMVAFRTVFIVGFGGAGFGLLTAVGVGYRMMRADAIATGLHPREPWLRKKDWADNKIRSTTGRSALILSVVAFYWNLFSAPAWYVFCNDLFAKGICSSAGVLTFPMFGSVLIVVAAVPILRRCKYGRSGFQMAAVPGVIGGRLAGVILVPRKVRPKDGFWVTLECVDKFTQSDGDYNVASHDIVWQDQQIVSRDLRQTDPGQTAIPVLFHIPYGCRPTDETSTSNKTIWRLRCSAKTSGLGYIAAFDVPVFKTPESDPNFASDLGAMAEYAAPRPTEGKFLTAGIVETTLPSGDGRRFVFPLGRNASGSLLLLVVWLVWSWFVVLLWCSGMPIFSLVLFGLFGVIILLAGLNLWFYRSTVDVSPAGLTVTGGICGLGRARRVDAAEVARIEAKWNGSIGWVTDYNIVAVRNHGKPITLGKHVAGRWPAEAICRQIEQARAKP
jgi:hypothetical protein